MIIKRSLRPWTMPALKRCDVSSSDDDEDDDSDLQANRKRPRPDLFMIGKPLPLIFRRDFAGDDTSSGDVASSSSTDVSYCSGEVQSAGNHRRPARTPRGRRVQVLPKRFAGSVMIRPRSREVPDSKTLDPDFHVKGARFGAGGRNSMALYTKEEEELYWACRNINGNGKKYVSTSRSTVIDERQWHDCNFEGEEEEEDEEEKRFVVGDVVWAQLGRKHPAWPAIVVNAMQRGSESSLDLCVPGSILVMFFGSLRAGNKRVKGF